MDVDGQIFVLPRCALRFLRAIAAALAGCNVGMGSIPQIEADVSQLFTGGADIAVAFGEISKALRAVKGIVLPQGIVSGTHIWSDAPLQ